MRDLVPHEETIPSLLNSVLQDMETEERQRDPIIVDPRLELVLDGMHRLGALHLLGAKYAICACFDYLDRSVILQRWLRYFVARDFELMRDLINLFALEQVENYEEATKKVDSRYSALALLSLNRSFVSKDKCDLLELYHKLAIFDSMALDRKINVDYRPDSGTIEPSSGDDSEFILYPLAFSKQDIIKAAKGGKLFPYKTTRHIVPIRPVNINFPLAVLRQGSIEACNTELQKLVNGRRIDLVGEGSFYAGRKYPEQLAIFREK